LWALASAGWANNFYAAAVRAGTEDSKAWLFGSLDPGNAITVDKPPASLWVMVLSARLFGFSSWSMLLPQALMGVGSVALVYSTVRRWGGSAAALLSATVMALTPVAAVMFRYNNPDALLVLLLVGAAYCTVRATETGAVRWILLAGTSIGFAFLMKLLQAFLIAPALALVFLIAAPGTLWTRLAKLVAGLAALILSAGWYVALVSLWLQ
jgi:4-amino-4-deoxy-L-arabinose transferase-like glycosyltransferase